MEMSHPFLLLLHPWGDGRCTHRAPSPLAGYKSFCLKHKLKTQGKPFCSFRNTPCSTVCSSCLCLRDQLPVSKMSDPHQCCPLQQHSWAGPCVGSLTLLLLPPAFVGHAWIIPGSSWHVRMGGANKEQEHQHPRVLLPRHWPQQPGRHGRCHL